MMPDYSKPPILGAPVAGGAFIVIPWKLHEEVCRVYSKRYGPVSPLHMADCGGFTAEELDDCVPNWRDRKAWGWG